MCMCVCTSFTPCLLLQGLSCSCWAAFEGPVLLSLSVWQNFCLSQRSDAGSAQSTNCIAGIGLALSTHPSVKKKEILRHGSFAPCKWLLSDGRLSQQTDREFSKGPPAPKSLRLAQLSTCSSRWCLIDNLTWWYLRHLEPEEKRHSVVHIKLICTMRDHNAELLAPEFQLVSSVLALNVAGRKRSE